MSILDLDNNGGWNWAQVSSADVFPLRVRFDRGWLSECTLPRNKADADSYGISRTFLKPLLGTARSEFNVTRPGIYEAHVLSHPGSSASFWRFALDVSEGSFSVITARRDGSTKREMLARLELLADKGVFGMQEQAAPRLSPAAERRHRRQADEALAELEAITAVDPEPEG